MGFPWRRRRTLAAVEAIIQGNNETRIWNEFQRNHASEEESHFQFFSSPRGSHKLAVLRSSVKIQCSRVTFANKLHQW